MFYFHAYNNTNTATIYIFLAIGVNLKDEIHKNCASAHECNVFFSEMVTTSCMNRNKYLRMLSKSAWDRQRCYYTYVLEDPGMLSISLEAHISNFTTELKQNIVKIVDLFTTAINQVTLLTYLTLLPY